MNPHDDHDYRYRPPSASPRPFQPPTYYAPPPPPRLPVMRPAPAPSKPAVPRAGGAGDFVSVGVVLVSALLLAFLLINFVFQSYQVEGPSMQRTLHNGDHLLVWKVDKSIARLVGRDYIPHRGDIIIFDEPAGIETTKKQLIKRVIALPGERVVYSGTSVTVYNKEFPQGFSPDDTMPYGDMILNQRPSNYDVTVPEGKVVVSGDNRDNSMDSRDSRIGPIDADLIVGRLIVRILPVNTFRTF